MSQVTLKNRVDSLRQTGREDPRGNCPPSSVLVSSEPVLPIASYAR